MAKKSNTMIVRWAIYFGITGNGKKYAHFLMSNTSLRCSELPESSFIVLTPANRFSGSPNGKKALYIWHQLHVECYPERNVWNMLQRIQMVCLKGIRTVITKFYVKGLYQIALFIVAFVSYLLVRCGSLRWISFVINRSKSIIKRLV